MPGPALSYRAEVVSSVLAPLALFGSQVVPLLDTRCCLFRECVAMCVRGVLRVPKARFICSAQATVLCGAAWALGRVVGLWHEFPTPGGH